MFISEINPIITSEYLRTKVENQYFERKGVVGDNPIKPSKIAEELIGMLNADGGVLALGISDEGLIEDVTSLGNRISKYRTLVHDHIEPIPNIAIEETTIDGKLIFLYHVEQDYERVYFRKESQVCFLRVSDANKKLDREGVRKLEYDKAIRKFEDELATEFDFEDFDENLLLEYQKRLNYDNDIYELLCKRALMIKRDGEYIAKNASILLFAQDPEKYIPSASVRYIRYAGSHQQSGEKYNVVKDQRFEGAIPTLIEKIKFFLTTVFRDYYYLDMDNGKFNLIQEYPEEAWLEGIVNSLCHRSYNVQGSSVYIKHYDEHLEIINSGPLPAQVTPENIRTERFSRNPRIARVLEDLGFVRQLNEGVNRIYDSMEKSMLSSPEYKEVNTNVTLALRNKVSHSNKAIDEAVFDSIAKSWTTFNSTQQSIIHYLFIHQTATKADLAKALGVHIKTITRNIKALEDSCVKRNSIKQRDPNAIYSINKER